MVECHLEQGYKLTPEQLAASITPRTRWLVLNHPGNPSGAVYSAAELQALAAVLRGHPQVLVMLDDYMSTFCLMAVNTRICSTWPLIYRGAVCWWAAYPKLMR